MVFDFQVSSSLTKCISLFSFSLANMNVYPSAVGLGRLRTKNYFQDISLDPSTLGSGLWQQKAWTRMGCYLNSFKRNFREKEGQ